MTLYELTLSHPGVQLRLAAGDPVVEAAVAAYERQYRTQAKRSGPNIFVTLLAGSTPGPKYFSVPDALRKLHFEWLVTLRESVEGFQTSSGRDASYGRAVFIPHSGGELLRPFGRNRGVASFSGRSLLMERLTWVKPGPGSPSGTCRVGINTLAVSLRPRFQHSREAREECDLPRESPYGFEAKVEEPEAITFQLDLTREGGVEQVVRPTSQGGFKPTIGWAELSPARQAAVQKFLCGELLEDYRLDLHERWQRYNDRVGQSEWTIPADTQSWREANRDKPRWQWTPEPREQRCEGELGLDGLPVRRAKPCGHLHFTLGVDPTHLEEEAEEEGGWYRDDDRW